MKEVEPMSNATANSDEMKTLKREAAELQERRQQNDQIASESAEQQEQSDPEEKMDQGEAPHEKQTSPTMEHLISYSSWNCI